MSKRREKAKTQNNKASSKDALSVATVPVRKEKLILESGKFCLDIAKLVFGGVILAGIMQQGVNLSLLLTVGLVVVLVFVILGFYLINKI